jgi:hypothetical protein
MDLSGQPDRFEALLRQELSPGERLLWHARALPRAKRGTLAILLFAIPWTAFAVFWTVMAFTMTRMGGETDAVMAWLFPAFGLPFIAVGLFMFAKPVLSRMAAVRTVYAVTDQRVIQLMAGKTIMSESVPVTRVTAITRKERRDGSGNLQLKLAGDLAVPTAQRLTGFDLGEVPGVRMAEQALRQAMERAGRPA